MKLRRRIFEVRYEKPKVLRSNTVEVKPDGHQPFQAFSAMNIPDYWYIKEIGVKELNPAYRHPNKAKLVFFARQLCRSIKKNGNFTQLRICRKDGSYQTEHTYGRDPKRHKG